MRGFPLWISRQEPGQFHWISFLRVQSALPTCLLALIKPDT